jgi:hypothetical protein
MAKKRFTINGPAGTMLDSTVPQTRFYLPAHLGGGAVDLSTLSLQDAANLYQNGWDVLVKKETPKEKTDRPDASEKLQKSNRKSK